MFCTRQQVTCEVFISKAFKRPCRKKLYLQLNFTKIIHSNCEIACIASVSVQFGSKELQGDEWRGRRKETLADKPLDFENRPHANRDVMLS